MSRRHVHVKVELPEPVHTRATAEATRRGLTVAAWVGEVVEIHLIPDPCAHGVQAPEAVPAP
jgi:hypothetical protein